MKPITSNHNTNTTKLVTSHQPTPVAIIHHPWIMVLAAPRQCMMVVFFLPGCRHTHMMTRQQ
jgi:hypothetical protein